VYKRKRSNQSKKRVTKLVKRVVTNLDEKKIVQGRNLAPYTAPATWSVLSLLANFGTFPGIAQGTSSSTRIGNRIRLVSMEVSIIVVPVITGTDNQDGMQCRFLIVKDSQCNGAVIAGVGGVMAAENIASPYNFQLVGTRSYGAGSNRLRVLLDKQHAMNMTSGTAAGPPMLVNFKVPVYGTIVEFSGAGVANSDILKNNIHLVFDADAGDCCNFEVWTSVIYTDA